MIAFETGRIRPPSEAASLLLRLTRGCHWNRCAFCPVYKDEVYEIRPLDEIKRDIDAMAAVAEIVRGRAGGPDALAAVDPASAHLMSFWLAHGPSSAFLQDADALVFRTGELVEILRHLRAAFPSITRVTSYSRAKTVVRKPLEDWLELRAAGLNRVHIGMESGSDAVLALLDKGVTRAEQICAGQRIQAAGMELSEYLMPGLGGRELSREHAVESAAVLTEVNPAFLRIRTTVPIPGTPLHEMMTEGRWTPMTEEEKVRELKDCLEKLGEEVTSTVQSDHVMNLLEDVAGTLPGGREQILAPIERFLAMSPGDREAFVVGRRIGCYRFLADYAPLERVDQVRRELARRFGSVEQGVMVLAAAYV